MSRKREGIRLDEPLQPRVGRDPGDAAPLGHRLPFDLFQVGREVVGAISAALPLEDHPSHDHRLADGDGTLGGRRLSLQGQILALRPLRRA